jgi:hypothetical protein
MKPPPYDHNLVDSLQLSAEFIALKASKQEQIAWIVFLLQELETFYTKEVFTGLLADLQESIEGRLASGRWD